jgi:hypothetical protein
MGTTPRTDEDVEPGPGANTKTLLRARHLLQPDRFHCHLGEGGVEAMTAPAPSDVASAGSIAFMFFILIPRQKGENKRQKSKRKRTHVRSIPKGQGHFRHFIW